MKRLQPGTRVRVVHQGFPYTDPVALLLVGRTGVIRGRSTLPRMDWDVEMDNGCFDADCSASVLVPIDDHEADQPAAYESEVVDGKHSFA